jgi:hypothetical protein
MPMGKKGGRFRPLSREGEKDKNKLEIHGKYLIGI